MATTAPLLKNDGLQSGSMGAGSLLLGVLSEGWTQGSIGKDTRVSMVPTVAAALVKDGYTILVEQSAGAGSGFQDDVYRNVGCQVVPRYEVLRQSKVIFAITVPEQELSYMKGKVLISWVGRLLPTGKKVVEKATAAGVMLVDVTAVPRITIAQKLDVLSSQAKVAGHRAVLEAAHNFGRFHSSEMTAAGKYAPSHTFVLGCGVAGLAAIGTSKALGSVVRAWDVRDVSDQVQSMGGTWVRVDFKEDGAGAGGYAKESSQEFQKAQHATFSKQLKEVDIAIATAAIPGRPSPLLITKDMVAEMKPGSVIVDLAALGGGNCELTRKGEIYVTPNGVTIIGYTDLAGRMGAQSSSMYAQNMANLLGHLSGKEKAAGLMTNWLKQLDSGEQGEIVARSIVCCRDGRDVPMPPPPQPTPPKPKTVVAPKAVNEPNPRKDAIVSMTVLSVLVLLLLGMGEGVPSSLLATFLLAGAAGYQAVWGVAHALHTPLMSVTNAISGLTAAGGIILLDKVFFKPGMTIPTVLAMVAIVVSAVNLQGGFIISQRMLNLFKRPGDKDYSGLFFVPGFIMVGCAIYGNFFMEVEEGAKVLKSVSTISSILCIAAIGALASQKTANTGCKFGMVGVLGALVSTFCSLKPDVCLWALGLMAFGGVFGTIIGYKVDPIALPQTVAAFHSLVGLAAMFTSIASFYEQPVAGASLHNIAAILGDFIGGVTLTGSIVAFAKLHGIKSSKALSLPFKNVINLVMLGTFIFLIYHFINHGGVEALYATSILAMVMGYHLVDSVGGGDMPVCITVLNSYSGWALVAEGFLLNSPVLTIVGSLIGFSGAILTKIMCDAMNRDIFNVIFGGMNQAAPVKKGEKVQQTHVEASIASTAELMASAKEVLIVPGYGMAVARAQSAVGEMAKFLREKGIVAKFGIHPVAGRMPGQMNVLLAEAGVPYDWVLEMDEVNPDMEKFDVCLIIGANDITNSAAQENEDCPIYGMPVIEVWRAKKTIFCKRSMAGGYADIENPVFFKDNTEMLLGDAKKTAEGLSVKIKESLERV